MAIWETKNMDPLNKVHIFEPMKTHTYEPFISLISLISLMFNCTKPLLMIGTTFPVETLHAYTFFPLVPKNNPWFYVEKFVIYLTNEIFKHNN